MRWEGRMNGLPESIDQSLARWFVRDSLRHGPEFFQCRKRDHVVCRYETLNRSGHDRRASSRAN